MLPFLVPLAETDVTVRAALLESARASMTSLGSGELLSGGEIAIDLQSIAARATYAAELYAQYSRVFDVAIGGGAGPPSDDLDAEATLGATWTLSPRATLALDAEGSLATTYGVRAETKLIELDPFLFGQRLEYASGSTLALSLDSSERTSLTLEAGYLQAGALAADQPSAIGVDTHEGHASFSYGFDAAPRITIAPELRYDVTHYYHALYDIDLHRGPADVHEASFVTAATRELGRGFYATAKAGLSIATPMPILHSRLPVVAPNAGLSFRWRGRRTRVTARYTYAYSSLGPRIGYGQQHNATLRFDTRPRDGAQHRDLALRGTFRIAHGSAPIAADPPLAVPGMPRPPPALGVVSATTFAAGARLEIPFARGYAFIAGSDLTFVRGAVGASSRVTGPSAELSAMFTIGVSATISTDKHRTVSRDPGEAGDDYREAPAHRGADERLEDRTRTNVSEPQPAEETDSE